MRILISNDDGVFADGIRTLAAAAASRGHQVTVVCPDQERSATGHGLTLQTPLRAERADALFAPGITAWACSGTPSDCVKLALFALLEEWPDLVLSGINHGPNLGTDTLYSGTVSAAMEGTIEGLPALAVMPGANSASARSARRGVCRVRPWPVLTPLQPELFWRGNTARLPDLNLPPQLGR
ncbi:MAG: 5'/3'-nucleotidase SurE [Synechococcaceae bacterium WB4_1_0192]|nr:5'/3'-nucleotidase SurE [Synechococcaceae bacterium WB4_1_0192]